MTCAGKKVIQRRFNVSVPRARVPGDFEVGNVAPFSRPGDDGLRVLALGVLVAEDEGEGAVDLFDDQLLALLLGVARAARAGLEKAARAGHVGRGRLRLLLGGPARLQELALHGHDGRRLLLRVVLGALVELLLLERDGVVVRVDGAARVAQAVKGLALAEVALGHGGLVDDARLLEALQRRAAVGLGALEVLELERAERLVAEARERALLRGPLGLEVGAHGLLAGLVARDALLVLDDGARPVLGRDLGAAGGLEGLEVRRGLRRRRRADLDHVLAGDVVGDVRGGAHFCGSRATAMAFRVLPLRRPRRLLSRAGSRRC